MARHQFIWENAGDGIQLRLEQKKVFGTRTTPVDKWVDAVEPNQVFAVGNLLRLLDEQDDSAPLVRMDGERLWVRNSVIAALQTLMPRR